jgi:hypothetical protein
MQRLHNWEPEAKPRYSMQIRSGRNQPAVISGNSTANRRISSPGLFHIEGRLFPGIHPGLSDQGPSSLTISKIKVNFTSNHARSRGYWISPEHSTCGSLDMPPRQQAVYNTVGTQSFCNQHRDQGVTELAALWNSLDRPRATVILRNVVYVLREHRNECQRAIQFQYSTKRPAA